MSIIIYKQMFRNPNFKDTPVCNYAHIRYIATRRGVMCNQGMTHGLFGKIDTGNDTQHFEDWREISKVAYELSRQNVNVFRSILSFQRKTANELGLKDQMAWREYVEQHIPEIAKQNGIKIENLQWACAVHEERHHPHAHIVFWDKAQQVMKKSTPSAIPDSIRLGLIKETFSDRIKDYFEKQYLEGNTIRKALIKSTFADELDALYKDREQFSDDIKAITNEMVAEYERYMKETYPGEYAEMKAAFETFDESSIDADPVYNCFNPEIVRMLGQRLFELKEKMPKSGRLNYKLLPPDIKGDVDKYTVLLLQNNKSLQKAVKLYVVSKIKILQMYTGDPKKIKKAKQDYKKEAEKLIANRVLAAVKKMLKEEQEIITMEKQAEYRQYAAEQLIIGLLDIFSRLFIGAGRIHDEFGGMAMSTELSKKARKEYYLAHKDKEKSMEH